MKIKVAIVEDQKETREMLYTLLQGSENCQCIAVYETAEEAIADMISHSPDVALVDIHLPRQSGIECVNKLKTSIPGTQFIMCTSLEDTDSIFNALQAGASGYLLKSATPEKIVEAINDAFNGGSPISSQIARKVVSYFQQAERIKKSNELAKLSAREQEILNLLSKGYRYKEIADKLSINIETVRKHVHNIYEKLQVSSRTDAINKAYNHLP